MTRPAPDLLPHAWLGIACLGMGGSALLAYGATGDAATQLRTTCAVAGLGGGTLVWIALDRQLARTRPGAIMLLALLVRLIALMGMPILEDDHFRYLWDGMRTATSLQPYALPPSAFFGDPAWDETWQDVLNGINNPDIPSIYGPTLQWLFAIGYLISPARLFGIQVLLLAVDLGTLALLTRARVPARLLLAYAVHPLVLSQSIVSAHPDGLLGLFTLAAMLAWRAERPLATGALLGLALGTKVSAVLLLPFFLWRPPLATPREAASRGAHVLPLALGGAFSLALLYLPFLWHHANETLALQTFAQQWQFNPLAFRLLLASGLSGAMARPVAVAMLALMLVGLLLHWRAAQARGADALWPPVDLAFAALLLVSPVVNPWYWLWGLAPSLLRRRHWAVAFGAVAFLSYFNSTVLFEAGWSTSASQSFAVAWPITLLELACLLACLLAQRTVRLLNPTSPTP